MPSRLRKGAFLIALGNPFNAARDGTPSASWGILSNICPPARARSIDDLESPPQDPRPDELPHSLQLDSKLNLGMSGGAVINLKGELVGLTTMASSPAGFDAMAGYAIPMDKIIRRAIETLKQGKEVEYGLLGISADPNSSQFVFRGSAQLTGRARDSSRSTTRSSPSTTSRSTDFDSLILAVNAFPAGEPFVSRSSAATRRSSGPIVLAKLAVEGEVIATNRPNAWRGLRVDYTSDAASRTFGTQLPRRRRGWRRGRRGRRRIARGRGGIKPGQLIRRGRRTRRSDRRREFADAVAGLEGPGHCSKPTWDTVTVK